MIYDIHTLQNRFYFHSAIIPSLHSSIPVLLQRLQVDMNGTECVNAHLLVEINYQSDMLPGRGRGQEVLDTLQESRL